MARLRKSGRILTDPRRRADLVRAEAELASGSTFFSLEPDRLFTRAAALEVEIGAGKGDFILERARQFPERNFLAIELAGSVFQWLAIRYIRSGLTNLRAIRADARSVVNLMLPAASVSAFHIYFPDPWPKSRHSKHRLFSPPLVAGLARCLKPGGHLYVATDVDWYFGRIVALLEDRGFIMIENGALGAARTSFGRRFTLAGQKIHAARFKAVIDSAVIRYGSAHAGS
jgi:tRNA (guanine-N(7)-)-methyltransferase